MYFGACSTLRATRKVEEFIRATAASGVCGFTKDVDWLQSSAVDLLLLPALCHQGRRDGAQKKMKNGATFAALTKKLGLTFV